MIQVPSSPFLTVRGTEPHIVRFGTALRAAGFDVLNDVVLNQVLLSLGTPEQTHATMATIQQEGACLCEGTVWQGRTAMRISVSNWSITDDDVERSIDAIIRCARSAAR